MSVENRVIEEEYILKLKELSKSKRDNYINSRYELIVRYIIDDQSSVIFKTLPVSDCYFQEMENYDQTPFVIKTDLFTELAELDKTNHGGLIKEIENLKKDFATKLLIEKNIRKDMDEGQKVERDHLIVQKFIDDYGYDPTTMSVMTKNINMDGLDMDLSENESEEEDDQDNTETIKEKNEQMPKRKPRTLETNLNTNLTGESESSEMTQDPNGDLAFINQILEISNVDFKQVMQDINLNFSNPQPQPENNKKSKSKASLKNDVSSDIDEPVENDDDDEEDEEDDDNDNKKPSKKPSKKVKKPSTNKQLSGYQMYIKEQTPILKKNNVKNIMQQVVLNWKALSDDDKQKYKDLGKQSVEPDQINKDVKSVGDVKATSASNTEVDTKTDDEKVKERKKEIGDLVQLAQELINVANALKKPKTDLDKSISAAQTIIDHYRNGDKLYKSEIKANLICLFLIKNYEDPKSMYDIGMALTKGISIVKNIKQGAKFMKVASEKYKYAPAMTVMKSLVKVKETKNVGKKPTPQT
jgi:hypothetical protein